MWDPWRDGCRNSGGKPETYIETEAAELKRGISEELIMQVRTEGQQQGRDPHTLGGCG